MLKIENLFEGCSTNRYMVMPLLTKNKYLRCFKNLNINNQSDLNFPSKCIKEQKDSNTFYQDLNFINMD